MTNERSNNQLMNFYGTAKSTVSRVAGRVIGNSRELTMRFYKEHGMWYADVPGWIGPKAMLLMVQGADTFLDYLSNNGIETTLELSLDSQEEYGRLDYTFPHPANDGAFYTTEMKGEDHLMWLCGVTEFVFGHMPEKIWYKK